jgi:hypothetical protein
MAGSGANVASVEAINVLRAALVRFAESAEAALTALSLEARRPLEWIEDDRTRYWPQQARRAADAVNEARIALERREARISGEDPQYCYDERKALEKAKRRLHLCEEKIGATRRWRVQMQKEVEELQVQIARLRHYLETDLVKAMATLEQMSVSLEKYLAGRSSRSGE